MAKGLTAAKPDLKVDIKKILTDFRDKSDENASPDEYIEEFSEKLTNAIFKFVIEAIVTTAGSATAQTGTLK